MLHINGQERTELDTDLKDSCVRAHSLLLPSSLLSMLDASVLARYYEFISKSTEDAVLIRIDESRFLGAAVVSLDPDTLNWRFFLKRIAPIGWTVFRSFLSNARIRKFIIMQVKGGADSRPRHCDGPELLQIYVDEYAQSKGVGTALLKDTEEWLRGRQISRYVVKTENVPANKALNFYRCRGYEEIGHGSFKDRPYVWFAKRL